MFSSETVPGPLPCVLHQREEQVLSLPGTDWACLAYVGVLKLETTLISWKSASTCPKSLMFSMGNCQTGRRWGLHMGKAGGTNKQLKQKSCGEEGGDLKSREKSLRPRESRGEE